MYNADAVVAMNSEQLVTVTDRLLVGRGRRPAPRSSVLPASLAPPSLVSPAAPARTPHFAFIVALPFAVGFALAVLR